MFLKNLGMQWHPLHPSKVVPAYTYLDKLNLFVINILKFLGLDSQIVGFTPPSNKIIVVELNNKHMYQVSAYETW